MFTEAPGEFREMADAEENSAPAAKLVVSPSRPPSSDYGIVTVDERGRVLSFSEGATFVFGYGVDEVVGHSVTLLMRSDDADHHQSYMDAYSETGRGRIVGGGRQVVGLRKDGTEFEMDLVVSESVLGGERVFTGVFRSFSRRHEGEHRMKLREAELSKRAMELTAALAALQEKTDALEESNSELEQFAYVASHDLQEPLRKIQAFGTRLVSVESENLSERGRDYLARMENAAERMQVLINDLLKFARVSTGARELVPEDLGLIINDVIDDLEVAIANVGATIDLPDHFPTVIGDSVQLRQVFQNLLGNALKFCVPGRPPVIRISVAQDADETIFSYESGMAPQEWFRITIEDNGIGFEPRYADRIFGIFQRLHGRTEYPGTGVGLAVCKKVIERHGGTIVATAVLGEGARFSICLPKP